jgi:hypothetical protein
MDEERIEQMTFVTVQDIEERLEYARYALEKIADGGGFDSWEEEARWARAIADNALDEI